jgi:accessory colonization factor AcfC
MSNKAQNSESCQTDIGSFYYRDFGFENIEFENTQDGSILIRCNNPDNLVTFEISKKEAIEIALALLKNCL